MSRLSRRPPPTADEIERRFRNPAVVLTRPVILGGIEILCAARGFNWRAAGLEHLRNLEPPIILAANHQSHADTAAILGTLHRRFRERTAVAAALDVFGQAGNGEMPSMKREFLQIIVAAGFHAFAFDRQGPPLRSLRTAARLMQRGWSLLLYPEGTRSRTGRIASFKPGVGVLAKFTRRPVVPVCVEGGRRILPCGAFLPQPGKVVVRYGRPMRFDATDTLESFAARLEEQVRALGGAPGAFIRGSSAR